MVWFSWQVPLSSTTCSHAPGFSSPCGSCTQTPPGHLQECWLCLVDLQLGCTYMRCKQRGCLFAIIKIGKRIAVMTALQLDSDSSQMFTTFLFMIQHDNSWTVLNKWMVITTCGTYTSTSLNRVCKKFHFNTSQRRALKLKWSSSSW